MATSTHDLVFVGGGLAALLFLDNVRGRLPARVAVVDRTLPGQRPTVHWSYWSTTSTPYDHFALRSWRQARVADGPPQHIAPYTLRVVRSVDVLREFHAALSILPIEWVTATVQSIARAPDGQYDVETTAGPLRTPWVFDSACDVPPIFPARRQPCSTVRGTEIRVAADRAVFDSTTATLFDPIDERTFAYLLPLSPTEALLESASFGPAQHAGDETRLVAYLADRHPAAGFTVTHTKSGVVPLGFAPPTTTGPQHILLGSKRGLVKPSAGYGVVRIAHESERLARRWLHRRQLPPSRRPAWRWRLVDKRFLHVAAHDAEGPMALLGATMRSVPVVQTLQFIDEALPLRRLLPLLWSATSSLSAVHAETAPVFLTRPREYDDR